MGGSGRSEGATVQGGLVKSLLPPGAGDDSEILFAFSPESVRPFHSSRYSPNDATVIVLAATGQGYQENSA
jgi:hypothetical protein